MKLSYGYLGLIISLAVVVIGISSGSGFLMTLGFIGDVVFLGIIFNLEKQKKEEFQKEVLDIMNSKLNEFQHFIASQSFQADNLELLIAIDEGIKKVCILENQENNREVEPSKNISRYNFKANFFDYKDILESEILIDGNTLTKTSRSGQVGGALIGGLLAGGVGAVIGGTGASKTSINQARSIHLQVTVKSMEKTFYRIRFVKFAQNMSTKQPQYKEAYDKALHWHNILSHVIKAESNTVESQLDISKSP